MKILLIDNYDSFTFNVVHLLRQAGVSDITVKRNTALALESLKSYDAVLASPGPGLPSDSGSLMEAVHYCLQHSIPYLGICLGHQALGEAMGAKLKQLDAVKHGVQEPCSQVVSSDLLHKLPSTFEIGRYHSWVVDKDELPSEFEVLAESTDGVIQAASVKGKPAFGLQFHPESIMSEAVGKTILLNFLNLAKR
ncbi:MAG: aminodeoxychorismate/anthranilate synthase component II [Saprospiraceae bacterium]